MLINQGSVIRKLQTSQCNSTTTLTIEKKQRSVIFIKVYGMDVIDKTMGCIKL